jgi:quinol monooxygenase YgiN
MAINLFQRVQVKDYDQWLNPDPDALAQMLKPQGVLAYNLYRNADDPNAVLIQLQFADRDALNAFQAWYEALSAQWATMHPGGEQKIIDNWVGEHIPSHSGTLQ